MPHSSSPPEKISPQAVAEPNAVAAESNAVGTRGRMGKIDNVKILGTGSYVPKRRVTNEDLAALGCDSDWIVRRTGIHSRYHGDDDQATSDLCYEASLRAMQSADITADQIDLVIVATMTPDHPTPSTACHLQRRLGATAPAMDVNAACAGFMYGMITAGQFIATGNNRCVLLVGADMMSHTIDPEDKKTYPLFGDAAGAVVMTPDENADAEILSYQFGSEGCGGEMLCVPAGGTRMKSTPATMAQGQQYLKMDGRNVFKWAVRVFDESARDVLSAANVQPDELSMVVLHQANQRIIDSAVSGLNLPPERVFVNLNEYGNTSGASIPLALDEAVAAGEIKKGDLVLLCGFGAGLSWGTALMRW